MTAFEECMQGEDAVERVGREVDDVALAYAPEFRQKQVDRYNISVPQRCRDQARDMSRQYDQIDSKASDWNPGHRPSGGAEPAAPNRFPHAKTLSRGDASGAGVFGLAAAPFRSNLLSVQPN